MGKKFKVAVGNPPYEKGLAHKFMEMIPSMLCDDGIVAFIVPSGFMTQPTQQQLRKTLLQCHGFRSIDLLPAGTFKTHNNKDVLRQTVVYIAQVGYSGKTKYYRPTGEVVEVSLSSTDPWIHFYSEISKGIWEKAQAFEKKILVRWWNTKTYNSDVSCVHFAEKTDALYVARVTSNGSTRNTIFDSNFGSSIHTGVISSTMAAPTVEQLKNKRAFVETSVPTSVVKWMNSHLYGVLLSMATTTQDITKRSVGALPLIEIPDGFSEEKAYDILGLTVEERNWLTVLRKRDDN